MLNNQTVKTDNQHHAMRQRERMTRQYLVQQRNLQLRLNEQRNMVRSMRTTDTYRDGSFKDCTNPAYIRETRRMRNLEAQLEFITTKMVRNQY